MVNVTAPRCGTPPNASSLTYASGTTRPIELAAKLSATLTVCVYTLAVAVDVLIDVVGLHRSRRMSDRFPYAPIETRPISRATWAWRTSNVNTAMFWLTRRAAARWIASSERHSVDSAM